MKDLSKVTMHTTNDSTHGGGVGEVMGQTFPKRRWALCEIKDIAGLEMGGEQCQRRKSSKQGGF